VNPVNPVGFGKAMVSLAHMALSWNLFLCPEYDPHVVGLMIGVPKAIEESIIVSFSVPE